MEDVKGTCADSDELGPLLRFAGEVSYISAFPGCFVTHTLEDARENAKRFCHLAPVAVYKIEILEVVSSPEPIKDRVG